MFNEQLTAKFTDFFVKKLGSVFLVWGAGVWFLVFTKEKKLLGLELTANDKGLLLVIFSLICLMAHHAIGWWVAKKAYYSPLSYRDDVFSDVKKMRADVNWLTLHSRQPTTIMGVNNLVAYKQRLESALTHSTNIPMDTGMDMVSPYIVLMRLATKAIDASATDADRAKLNTQMQKAQVEFLKRTDWVLRK